MSLILLNAIYIKGVNIAIIIRSLKNHKWNAIGVPFPAFQNIDFIISNRLLS